MIIPLIFALTNIVHSQSNIFFCRKQNELDLEAQEMILDHLYQDDINFILTNKYLRLYDPNYFELKSFLSPISPAYSCNILVGHDKSNVIFVACQQQNQPPYLAGYKKVTTNIYQSFGEFNYMVPIKEPITKLAIIKNTLLIQQNQKIVYYTIVINSSSFYLKTTSNVIDAQYLEQQTLNITDFTYYTLIIQFQEYIQVCVLDQNNKLYDVRNIIQSNLIVPYFYQNVSMSLSGLPDNIKFRKVLLPSNDILILQSYDHDSYRFSYISKQTMLTSTLSKYQNWIPTGEIQEDDFIVSMIYQNNDDYALVLYNVLYSNEQNSYSQNYSQLINVFNISNFITYFYSDSMIAYTSENNQFQKCNVSSVQEY